MKNKGCKEPGCDGSHYGMGYCRGHYCQDRYRRPDINRKMRKLTKESQQRFRVKRLAHKKQYSGVLRMKFIKGENNIST